jgi:glyoxylase-like metal-dependent hydrolase (beta-lactamase superfamily II)
VEDILQIPVPLPHIRTVNTWLLRGDPLTLVDTGPHADDALEALEAGLRRCGIRIEDLELVLVTHHHLDHSGLAATIAARSGAPVGALDRAADYGERYVERAAADRRFSHALMRHHGVPDAVVDGNEGFWDYIREASDAWHTQVRLRDGDRIRAGGRELRVIARPGHSTTDALFVDDHDGLAFVGDHLLASVSSNTEIYPAAEPDGTRPRARVEYLEALRKTAALPLRRLLSGHGDPIAAHAALVKARFDQHQRRCERILEVLERGPATAYGITRHLWPERIVAEQTLLVVWEVLGHLDLLLDAGAVTEHKTDDGSRHGLATFALAAPRHSDAPAAPQHGFRFRDPRNHEPTGGGGRARSSRHAHQRPRR